MGYEPLSPKSSSTLGLLLTILVLTLFLSHYCVSLPLLPCAQPMLVPQSL